MSKPNGPCLNCTDRDEICHAHCIAYRLWRAKRDEEKDREIKKRRESESGITAHYQKVMRKKKGAR